MIGQKFLAKDCFNLYKHCITTLGRISGLAMEGLVCQEVCFRCSNLGIDSYSINSAGKEINCINSEKERNYINKLKNIVSLINSDLILQFPL
jgi:hypothetical protein